MAVNEGLLRDLYYNKKLTDKQIAEKLGLHRQTIFNLRKKYNMESLAKSTGFNLKVSSFQKQILLGTFLGDAYITPYCDRDSIIEIKHPCDVYDQTLYVKWLSFCLSNIFHKITYCDNGKKIKIKSHAHPIFNKIRDLLYVGKVKTITQEYLNMLSPLALAVWYMNSGTIQGRGNGANLSTQNFTLKENEIISEWLFCKFNIENKIGKDGKHYHIKFNNEGAQKLWRTIDKYIIQSMWYKIGDRSENKLVYLAGAMESIKDEGLTWRRKYSKRLLEVGLRSIIPNDEEAEIKNSHDMASLKQTNISQYIDIMRDFIRADLTFINAVDMVVCHWEGEMSAGTMGEITYAYDLEKPTYLVTSLSPQDVPGWFLACFTETFSSLGGLVKYLKEMEWE